MKDTIIDLCCGTCGWSRPWIDRGVRIVAFDIYKHQLVPPQIELRIADIKSVSGKEFAGRTILVLASPPCDEYARFTMPWTRAKNPPEPSLSLWQNCERIAIEAEAPLVLENVQTAQRWHGPARWHFGPFYLWGDGVPALMPKFQPQFFKKKESYGSKQKDLRAEIPAVLAEHFAEIYSIENGSGGIMKEKAEQINALCAMIHGLNAKWWIDIETGKPLKRNVGELLMLCVSELAEAMEGDRKNLMDDKLPHRKMFEVELADCVIRICDLAGGLGYDLGGAIIEKCEYNKNREDHQLESRKKENGKKY